MDYAKHYARLVVRARSRALTGYCERHHVRPRCLGGGNEQRNIVRLTAREHYVAHQLLVKMHPGADALVRALRYMGHQPGPWHIRSRNRVYGWIRERFAEACSRAWHASPLRPWTGRRFSDEHRANLSAARAGRAPHNKGVPMGEVQRAKMSAALRGRAAPNKGMRTPEAVRAKLRDAKALARHVALVHLALREGVV